MEKSSIISGFLEYISKNELYFFTGDFISSWKSGDYELIYAINDLGLSALIFGKEVVSLTEVEAEEFHKICYNMYKQNKN